MLRHAAGEGLPEASIATSGYVPNVVHPQMMRSILQGIIDTGDVLGAENGCPEFDSRANLTVSSRQGAVASQDHSGRGQQLEA